MLTLHFEKGGSGHWKIDAHVVLSFVFPTKKLTLFFMGEGKFYPAKIFLLILKNYQRFFREPNLVLKVFWKFQVNSMPILTLMTILLMTSYGVFFKQNFLYYYKNHHKNNIKQLFIFNLKFLSFILKYPVKSNGHLKLKPFFGPKTLILSQKMLTSSKICWQFNFFLDFMKVLIEC